MNERSHIHLLAAWEFMRRDGKVDMRSCLGIAEAAFVGAEVEDTRVQTELAAEEKAAQVPAPLTDKVQ